MNVCCDLYELGCCRIFKREDKKQHAVECASIHETLKNRALKRESDWYDWTHTKSQVFELCWSLVENAVGGGTPFVVDSAQAEIGGRSVFLRLSVKDDGVLHGSVCIELPRAG